MKYRQFNRQGQLQSMEPIVIVIFVAIVIGIALLFFVNTSRVDTKLTVSRMQSEEDLDTLTKITRMPELMCPSTETGTVNCIDLEKAKAFAVLQNNDARMRIYYTIIFSNANVTLYWYEPSEDKVKELTLFATQRNMARVRATTTYFSVFEPVSGNRKLAWLVIRRDT